MILPRAVFFSAALLISASSTRLAFAEENVLKLGLIAPLTGDSSGFGRDAKNAIDWAIEELNSTVVLPGTKMKLIAEDGKCQGKDAALAARKLIDIDKVKIIIGGLCSGETLGAAPIAERNKVILLSPFSSHPDITEAGDYIFRITPSDKAGGEILARYMLAKGFLKVAAVTENTDYALGVRDVFAEVLKQGGAELAADEYYNPGERDFRSLILRIKAKEPQALLLNPQAGIQAGLLVKHIRELKWQVPVLGSYTYSSEDAVRAAGGIAQMEDVIFTDISGASSARAREFMEKFRQRHTSVQSEFLVLLTYDAVNLLAQAVQHVGLNTDKVRDYLYSLAEYQGLEQKFHFDRNGDVVGVDFVFKQYRNGRMSIVDTRPDQ